MARLRSMGVYDLEIDQILRRNPLESVKPAGRCRPLLSCLDRLLFLLFKFLSRTLQIVITTILLSSLSFIDPSASATNIPTDFSTNNNYHHNGIHHTIIMLPLAIPPPINDTLATSPPCTIASFVFAPNGHIFMTDQPK